MRALGGGRRPRTPQCWRAHPAASRGRGAYKVLGARGCTQRQGLAGSAIEVAVEVCHVAVQWVVGVEPELGLVVRAEVGAVLGVARIGERRPVERVEVVRGGVHADPRPQVEGVTWHVLEDELAEARAVERLLDVHLPHEAVCRRRAARGRASAAHARRHAREARWPRARPLTTRGWGGECDARVCHLRARRRPCCTAG